MGANGLGSTGVAAAVGEPCLVLVRHVLLTTFDIGCRFDTGTTGMAIFRLLSEGREGAICAETGTDGSALLIVVLLPGHCISSDIFA